MLWSSFRVAVCIFFFFFGMEGIYFQKFGYDKCLKIYSADV